MVIPTAGSVVLFPFPFSDLSRSKLRPAIALADIEQGDWVFCQVTSNPYADSRAVEIDKADFASGTLRVLSYARPGKLFTANQQLLVAQVAVLNDEAFERVRAAVLAVFHPKGRGGP